MCMAAKGSVVVCLVNGAFRVEAAFLNVCVTVTRDFPCSLPRAYCAKVSGCRLLLFRQLFLHVFRKCASFFLLAV